MLNTNHAISSENFDLLLNQAFLELDFSNPKNESLIQTISNHVMLTNTYAFSGQTSFIKKIIGRINSKILILFITAIVSITGGLVWLNNPKLNLPEPKHPNSIIRNPANVTTERKQEKKENNQELPAMCPKQKPPIKRDKDSSFIACADSSKDDTELSQYSEPPFLNPLNTKTQTTDDSAYIFPKLNGKEIKANNKQKKIMLEKLMKFSKDKYALVPAGSFIYKKEALSVGGFYMQMTEVSNLEYRTFLFDLLIQNRKEEFLKAKPDQMQWIKGFDHDSMQTWVDNYFTLAFYNIYPVVNISREGAEMYCRWLTNETNYYILEQKKNPINDMRIPTDAEWAYAASGGITNASYPWPGDSIRNPNGCILANFCLKKYKLNFGSMVGCKPKYINAYTTAGLMLGYQTYAAPTDTYSPNNFRLFNMSGNVAEMVYVMDLENKKKKSIHGTKGGSWNSDAEHLKINSEDEYAGITTPSPFVGFRPVIFVSQIK